MRPAVYPAVCPWFIQLLNEQGFPPDVIELQLAHAERNKVPAAYNKAQRLPERRKMMQGWREKYCG
jgi:hypothetical protein